MHTLTTVFFLQIKNNEPKKYSFILNQKRTVAEIHEGGHCTEQLSFQIFPLIMSEGST